MDAYKRHIMNDNKEPIKTSSLHEAMNRKDDKGNFVLTPLPYTDDHLEPYIGTRTVRFHYWKHLRAYIDKVNALKGKFPLDVTIEGLIGATKESPLYNNSSQVFNHYFYFEQLNTKGAKQPLPMMWSLIERHYGSWDNLKAQIIKAGMDVFGSGWVFLTTDRERKCLWVRSFSGTRTPKGVYEIPILALDVWEHAYYLDYQNDRKLYIERFFEAIDWSVIERRLTE